MSVKVYFESHKDVIIEVLSKAETEVKIAVAWINFKEYKDIFHAVLDKKVALDIICTDNKQNRAHQNEINALESKGATIRLLKMPRVTNHMHHKFCVIDSKTILTGSFNWSPNAVKSFENLMLIENEKDAVTTFLNEFDSLKRISPAAIKTLQKKKKCSEANCNGELFNILVFSERTTKYMETFGDLIEVCSSCDNFKVIENCISDTQLHLMLNAYRECQDDFELEQIDRDINMFLNNYLGNHTLIHAIGRVTRELRYPDDEFITTNIIWKNKFVGNRVLDEYETDFEVLYDN